MTPTQRNRWTLGAAAGLCLLLLAAWWWSRKPANIHAIVVQGFTGEAMLAEPLRDVVRDDLGRVPGLAVVERPADSPVVTGLLDARVERTPERIKIIAELHRADGHRYWTRTVDRQIADLPLVAEDVAALVSGKARRKPATKYKPGVAAYEAYLEGRYRFDHPESGGLALGIARLEDATRLDPAFAEAWAWLSIAKEYLADSGAVRPNLALPEARDAADRAAALDPTAAESHLAVGIADLQYDWNWDAARAEIGRAAQLSPGWPLAAYWQKRWNEATGHAAAPDFHFANLPPVAGEADAQKLLEDADDIRVETYISAAALALVANRIHDTEDTFRWLDEAYDERCVQLPYILWDPSLPRGDPRFADLMRRMKLGGSE
jgi:hypothetical protein